MFPKTTITIPVPQWSQSNSDHWTFHKKETNRKKLKDFVHLLCCLQFEINQSGIEKIKLHTILWYSETLLFNFTGEQITYETFTKKPLGIYADHLESVLAELIAEKKLEVKIVDGNECFFPNFE